MYRYEIKGEEYYAERMTSQETLAKIALNTFDNVEARVIAINKLTDKDLLTSIIKDSSNHSKVIIAAIQMISDEGVLDEIISDKKRMGTDERIAAIRRTENYKLLTSIISTWTEDSKIRIAATERITEIVNDEKVLGKIFFDDNSSFEVQKIIVQKIKSEVILKKIALSLEKTELRKIAVEKLTDEGVLISIANKLSKHDTETDFFINREVILAIIPKLSKEKIKQLKSNDWYINAVCEDILNNQ